MPNKHVSPRLARLARESRIVSPKVDPRVTRERALQLLGKHRGGAQLLRRMKALNGPSMPTPIAYFTPRTFTGNVGFVDFYNADLRAGWSDVATTYETNQVYFDASKETAYDGIRLKHPNGVVQAFFDIEAEAQLLLVAKVSSKGARLYLAVGSRYGESFRVQGDGVELAVLKLRAAGVHRVNLIQRTTPTKPFWFHSMTVFQV